MIGKYQSLQIGKVLGIPILVHWTFSLFIIFILFTAWKNNFPLSDSFWFVAFVFILFFFVILHELGHSMAARKYGIQTRDIIISPIGGIARLENMPHEPMQELFVAIAGPLVNVCLALIFISILLPFSFDLLPVSQRINLYVAPLDYLRYLLLINVSLVVFNLIPAFPMDGGRVFRALLSIKFDRVKATYIAAAVAKFFAILFLILGVYLSHVVLILIGGFVLFTSGREYSNVIMDKIFHDHSASEAVLENAITLSPYINFGEIKNLVSAGQSNYLIQDENSNLVGCVTKPLLKYIEKEELWDQPIYKYMATHFGTVHEDVTLNTLFSIMNKNGWYIVNVISRNHDSIGIIDREILEKFVAARKKTLKY